MNAARKRRMCRSKRQYSTQTAALRAAIEASKNFGPMRVYPCPVCGAYHLTSKVG